MGVLVRLYLGNSWRPRSILKWGFNCVDEAIIFFLLSCLPGLGTWTSIPIGCSSCRRRLLDGRYKPHRAQRQTQSSNHSEF